PGSCFFSPETCAPALKPPANNATVAAAHIHFAFIAVPPNTPLRIGETSNCGCRSRSTSWASSVHVADPRAAQVRIVVGPDSLVRVRFLHFPALLFGERTERRIVATDNRYGCGEAIRGIAVVVLTVVSVTADMPPRNR